MLVTVSTTLVEWYESAKYEQPEPIQTLLPVILGPPRYTILPLFYSYNFISFYDLPSSFHQCNSTIDPTCSPCFLSSGCFAIDTNRLTRLCVWQRLRNLVRYTYATAYYYNGTSLLDEIIEANSNHHKLVIPTRCRDLICF